MTPSQPYPSVASGTFRSPRRIALFGSTGSIGTQALEVIEAHPDLFEVEVLTAQSNVELLIRQARTFKPNAVAIGNVELYSVLKEALSDLPIKVFAGEAALVELAAWSSIDMVLASIVGFAGLKPTLAAIEQGTPVALANKETLVVAGELVMASAARSRAAILPVDSEHSAIFQCLQGEQGSSIEKIILTASGGPFFGKDETYLAGVRKEHALKHPNWSMGQKITIDSATLMNKGLEMIEAKWLFGLNPDQIDVVVHRQSIVHSLVQFTDGSLKAQLGLPDMKLPIQYALGYPGRISNTLPRFDFRDYAQLTFEAPDTKTFRNLALAMEVMRMGGNAPCIMNAVNEEVVYAFLQDRIGFLEIPGIIETVLSQMPHLPHPNFHDYLQSDREARDRTRKLIP